MYFSVKYIVSIVWVGGACSTCLMSYLYVACSL